MKNYRILFILTTVAAAAISCSGCEMGNDPNLGNILVTTAPTKTSYLVGETFDPTGMVVTGYFNDGTQKEITNYTYKPNTALTIEDTYVLINYKQASTRTPIKVTSGTRVQTGIEVTTPPKKTVYEEGETFSNENMVVKKVYNDGTGDEITDYTWSPTSALSLDDKEITISSGNFTTKITIRVVKQGTTLNKIEIARAPNKTEYNVGEYFVKTGMVVKAYYSDGSSSPVVDYTIEPNRALNENDTQITVTYNGKTATQSITVKKQSETGYYEGINPNSSNLLNDLNHLNSQKRKSTVGYKAMLNNPEKGFYVTDPGTGSGTITTFYSGKNNNGTGGLNREHVWPESRGGNLVESDIHMPRPTLTKENGSRGNSFYVEGKKSPSSGWDPAMESFGLESYRGDSARIIFYCAIANTTLKLVDKENDSTGNKTMGKLSDLLRWNLKYPVLDREMVRNDGAESLQGNRNPFIDHPEYACKIWGLTNATTKSICGM